MMVLQRDHMMLLQHETYPQLHKQHRPAVRAFQLQQ